MNYKKLVISIVVTLALLFPILAFVSKQYDKASFGLKKEKANWILNKKNESYDVAFLGSSRVLNTLDPLIADSILSLKCINLGVGGAAYPEIYLLLDVFLKTNKVKTICLQVDMWGLIPGEEAYSHPFSEEKYLHLLGDPTVDSIYLKNSNPLKFYFRRYIPFFKYSEYNSMYSMEKMLFDINPGNKNNYDQSKGSTLIKERKGGMIFNKIKTDKLKKVHYSSNSAMSLRNIISLAKSKDINIVLFTSPSYKPFMKFMNFDKPAKDTIHALANQFHLQYFDFEKSYISSDTILFRDFTHLNYKGGVLFTSNFCDTLKKYNYGKN